MVYAMTGAFILLDLVTGVVKALKEKQFRSNIMREGLFHKVGSILCVVLATLIDYAQHFIDLGATIPVTAAVCAYIILMEIGSSIENVSAINPEIVPEKLRSVFGKLNGGDNNVDA